MTGEEAQGDTGEATEETTDDSSSSHENDPAHWRSQFETAEKARRETEARLQKLEANYNKTRTELRNTREKHATTPEGREELEKHIRAEYEGRFNEEITSSKDKISNLENTIRRLTITNQAKSKAAEYFNPDVIDLIVNEVEKHADLDGEDVVIKDSAGTVRMSSSQRGQRMTIDELLKELLKKYPSGARPTMRSGAQHEVERATSRANGAIQGLPRDFASWSKQEQVKFFAKNPDIHAAFYEGKLDT